MSFNQVILELRVFESTKKKRVPQYRKQEKDLAHMGTAHAKVEDIQGHHIFRIEGPLNLQERILGDKNKKGS